MLHSVFSSPNPVLFGRGTINRLGGTLQKFGCKRVLVIYDTGIKKAGIADKVIDIIKDAGIEIVPYDGVVSETPDWMVEEAGALGVSKDVDGIVGIGGGSSLNAAKAAKVLLTNPPPISRYYTLPETDINHCKPLVLIPTTSGTGAECTPSAVVSDTGNGLKRDISGECCRVELGIVDPELTLDLPQYVTAVTGLDALCHAAESYTSSMPNSICDVTAREAIILLGKYLVRAYNDGSDIEAREAVMLASTLGGITMNAALCHLSHDIGKFLSARLFVPHGNACAVTLPQVLQAAAPAVPERVRFIAESFGAEIKKETTPEEIGNIVCDVMKTLLKTLNLPNMRELELNKSDILELVPDSVVALQTEIAIELGQCTSPVPVSRELIESIISRAYDEN